MKQIDIGKLEEIIEDLNGKLLVVEGKKDEEALKRFGLKNIIAINGRPLYEVTEKIGRNKEIIILTDFDQKGKEINSKLTEYIKREKKRFNPRLRKKIQSLGISNIEDLKNVVGMEIASFKEDDYHVKISTNIDKIRNKSADKRKRSNREAGRNRSGIRTDGRASWIRPRSQRTSKNRKNRKD